MTERTDQGLSKEAWRGLAIMVICVGLALMLVLWKPLLMGLGQHERPSNQTFTPVEWAAMAEIGSFLVSSATLATVFYGFRQADKTRREDIRAYVRADIGDISVGPGMLVAIPIKIFNYGKTLASAYYGVLTCTIITDGFQKPIVIESGFGSGQLHPGAPADMARHRDIYFNADAFERMRSGRTEITILVNGCYIDTFGVNHPLVNIATFAVNFRLENGTAHFTRLHR